MYKSLVFPQNLVLKTLCERESLRSCIVSESESLEKKNPIETIYNKSFLQSYYHQSGNTIISKIFHLQLRTQSMSSKSGCSLRTSWWFITALTPSRTATTTGSSGEGQGSYETRGSVVSTRGQLQLSFIFILKVNVNTFFAIAQTYWKQPCHVRT